MMNKINAELSPFEFKERLIKLAKSHAERNMLNAGRGNPNFLATMPRHAFLRLGDFALKEAERTYSYLDNVFGGVPEKQGIAGRFDQYILLNEKQDGVSFLQATLSYAFDRLGIEKEDFLYEVVIAFLGCYYPYPPRILPVVEEVVRQYLQLELFPHGHAPSGFNVFATEGGTAAMTYIFQTLKVNDLIASGDRVAMITPIFSPYLEIPTLPQFGCEVVDIRAHEQDEWQVEEQELQKLEDPSIKVLCMVNPSNPPSVKMASNVLQKLADFVETKRPDLMIVTDDVYATFADNFESLFSRCPYNTLCVYSFSKYFGATGWRLGVIALHEDNVFDDALKKLKPTSLEKLDRRYASLTPKPRSLTFIDRLVADSRSVALNHTAGLSLPQQLQMLLLAFASLLDTEDTYRHAAKRLIRQRYQVLYQAISPKLHHLDSENLVGYYTLLDLEKLAGSLYNEGFAKWVLAEYSGQEFLMHLADETGVVLLPGKGFEAEHPSARVSLANLREADYRSIGLAIQKLLAELNERFLQK